MATLLFEIGTEDLPSWYVRQGREALEALTRARLEEARLSFAAIEGYATPRRLAVRVDGLAEESERRIEARRGPSVEVAFDEEGRPTRAAAGFARSQGVAAEALVAEETERGAYVFARIERGGETAESLLPPLLAGLVRDLPAPRKMRWGEVETAFVRPVAWLLALLDEQVLEVEVAGVRAGRTTRGHRFLAPGPFEVAAPDGYLEILGEAQVLARPEPRARATEEAIRGAAAQEGLVASDDPALRAEVTDLVEHPFGLLGRFDEAYLDLPEPVLTTVMIHHQRYVPLRRPDGRLAARFVGVSNNRVPDPDVVRGGYEQVLEGRLADARFFWDADRAKTLSQHAWALSGIAFQKELGSMADKVTRVSEGAPALAEAIALPSSGREALLRALPVFRADLATEMVGEFPELEGTMARAYALAEGQPEAVAQVLEDGVRPQGPRAPLPASEAGAVLAVADRLDKLVGFFALGKRPSGSADPFGLRRDAVAVARIASARGWSQAPARLLEAAAAGYSAGGGSVGVDTDTLEEVEAFLWDRVAALLAEEGVRVTEVRAAAASRPPVIAAARRAHLLHTLAGTSEFDDLLALYKRAANLAEQATEAVPVDPELFRAEQEAPLHQALEPAREGVRSLLAQLERDLPAWELGHGRGEGVRPGEGLAPVLALKGPLDAFLDDVLVMVEDREVRENRLALLRDVRDTLRELGALEELAGG